MKFKRLLRLRILKYVLERVATERNWLKKLMIAAVAAVLALAAAVVGLIWFLFGWAASLLSAAPFLGLLAFSRFSPAGP